MDAPIGRNDANPPALPGQGAAQPTPQQKAAVEARWNDPIRIMQQVLEVLEREGKPAADDLVRWVNAHKNK